MADSENKHVEIDEVQEFGGGEIKSVEPIAEGDTQHGVHGNFHEYSGGQVLERTDTTLSPILWWFYATVILVIVATLLVSGAIPGVRLGSKGYARPTLTTNTGYNNIQGIMQNQASYAALTSPAYIDMYQLPRPNGQTLPQAISAGSDVYQSYCIGCHGPNQDGAGPNAVSLNPSPRNLRDQPFMQAMSYQRIWTSVHKGVPGTAMPRWENTLSDTQISDVICYVFSITAPVDKSGNYIKPSPTDIAGSTPAASPAMGATVPAQ
jgi:mono/diheme cytochrome c family protein